MNIIIDRKIKNIFIIIFIFLLVVTLFLNFKFNRIFMNEQNLAVDFKLTTESLDINVGQFRDIKVNIYSTHLNEQSLNTIQGNKKLLLYQLDNLWHRVYFNDVEIGGSGAFFDDGCNACNDLVTYDIPNRLIQKNNQLIIESYHLNDFNKSQYTSVITDYKNANKIRYFISNITYGLVYFILGLVFVQITIFAIYLIFFNKKSKYWSFILGIFFLGVAQLRHLPLYLNIIGILIFKKLMLVAVLMSLFFICYGFYSLYHSKRNLIIGLINLILALIITAQTSMINLLLIEKYLIIIVLFNLINWIISARIEIKNEIVNKIISLGATILLITYSLEALIIYMTTIKIELSLFGIIVFIISLSAIALSDIEELFVIVQKHREQSERYYDKSIKDQMTDLYNKEFIRNELFASDYKYSLIMFDIDDFKAINDTYGHDVGDQAIINVANIAKHMVRSSDVVGRFGGDEFIIIAKECNAENAYRIAKQIKDKVESQLYIEKNELDIRISMGIYENFTNNPFEVALKNVDDRLYMAKEQGKSTIVWDDNG